MKLERWHFYTLKQTDQLSLLQTPSLALYAGTALSMMKLAKLTPFACFLSKAVSFVTPSLNLANSPFWSVSPFQNPLYTTQSLDRGPNRAPAFNHPVFETLEDC